MPANERPRVPRGRSAVAAAVVAVSLALPAGASAARIDLIQGGIEAPTRLEYKAAAGEQNKLDVVVAADQKTAEISDPGAGTITPGSNCTAQNAKKVTCTAPSNFGITFLTAELLDGNDTTDVAGVSSALLGGEGNDTLRGGVNGDTLRGGGGTDELRGNGGGDFLDDGDTSGAANKDTLDGGEGRDLAFYPADGGADHRPRRSGRRWRGGRERLADRDRGRHRRLRQRHPSWRRGREPSERRTRGRHRRRPRGRRRRQWLRGQRHADRRPGPRRHRGR